jgi:hypothetical protein
MACESVNEVVLATVRLIRDHDDVLALREAGHSLPFGREELLNGGEHHPAACDLQQLPEVVSALRLDGLLPQQLLTSEKLPEELVVEVVPVGKDHDGGVPQRWVANHPRGIEQHGEALARPLRVPDNPRSTIPRATTLHRSGPIAAARFLLGILAFGQSPVRVRDAWLLGLGPF